MCLHQGDLMQVASVNEKNHQFNLCTEKTLNGFIPMLSSILNQKLLMLTYSIIKLNESGMRIPRKAKKKYDSE